MTYQKDKLYGVTETTCDACLEWIGRTVSLTGRAYRGFPALEDAVDEGLFHPNCIHYLEPPVKTQPSHYVDISRRPEIDAMFVNINGEPRVNTKRSRPGNVAIVVGTPAEDLAKAIKAEKRRSLARFFD